MKTFIYFENTEGGMQDFLVYSEEDLSSSLPGWKYPKYGCLREDTMLLEWMEEVAEVGETYSHRCGVLVRLKDEK